MRRRFLRAFMLRRYEARLTAFAAASERQESRHRRHCARKTRAILPRPGTITSGHVIRTYDDPGKPERGPAGGAAPIKKRLSVFHKRKEERRLVRQATYWRLLVNRVDINAIEFVDCRPRSMDLADSPIAAIILANV